MLINTMEEESLSEGMVSQITVEYKMFGSDKMELMEGIGRAIRRIYYGVCGMLMKNPYFLTKENYSPDMTDVLCAGMAHRDLGRIRDVDAFI